MFNIDIYLKSKICPFCSGRLFTEYFGEPVYNLKCSDCNFIMMVQNNKVAQYLLPFIINNELYSFWSSLFFSGRTEIKKYVGGSINYYEGVKLILIDSFLPFENNYNYMIELANRLLDSSSFM